MLAGYIIYFHQFKLTSPYWDAINTILIQLNFHKIPVNSHSTVALHVFGGCCNLSTNMGTVLTMHHGTKKSKNIKISSVLPTDFMS